MKGKTGSPNLTHLASGRDVVNHLVNRFLSIIPTDILKNVMFINVTFFKCYNLQKNGTGNMIYAKIEVAFLIQGKT